MLKTFSERVEATYALMVSLLKTANRDRVLISRARDAAIKSDKAMTSLRCASLCISASAGGQDEQPCEV